MGGTRQKKMRSPQSRMKNSHAGFKKCIARTLGVENFISKGPFIVKLNFGVSNIFSFKKHFLKLVLVFCENGEKSLPVMKSRHEATPMHLADESEEIRYPSALLIC